MDDLTGGGPPPEGQDREAAVALADIATALAQEADPVAADAAGAASENPAGRTGRLRQWLRSRRWPSPRSWAGPRLLASPRLSVEARRRVRRATWVVLAAALVLGFGGAAPSPNGPTPSASGHQPASAGGAGANPGPTASLNGGSPSYGPGDSAGIADAGGIPPDTSRPTHTSPAATITFNDLMLDSSSDSARSARTFSFVSDGLGTVSAQIVATSPMDSTKLCLKVDQAPTECVSGATPDFTQPATTAHSHWTVTLISANESPPTVDVAFSWPTDHPSITLTHGRLQGSPNPDSLRTLTATFRTRAAGRLSVDATWPPSQATALLTLTDVSGAAPIALDTATYPNQASISPAYSHSLAAGHAYRVALFNDSADTARTNLTATIDFP